MPVGTLQCIWLPSIVRQLLLITAVQFWVSIYIYTYMCALPSCFVKECNKVSTASAYCHEHRRSWHGWFQRWLIPKMADWGGDQRKSRQDWKRKQWQSASEGIIKEVKGYDAERRLDKQRQRMANHRAHETGKQRYQQVISVIGLLNHQILLAQVTSLCPLVASHIIHVYARLLSKLTYT